MNRKSIATVSVAIKGTAEQVWDALVNPEMIRQYYHGADTITDWQIGSPIVFRGVYNGQEYLDKGVIFENHPLRSLGYSHWSSLSGKDDYEENYVNVTFHLAPYDHETALTVTQDNIDTDEERIRAEENWIRTLNDLKAAVERNTNSSDWPESRPIPLPEKNELL